MFNFLLGLTIGILLGIHQPDAVIAVYETITGTISDNLS